MSVADAHLHLDFFANPAAFAQEAQACGLQVFANSVTPQGFLATTAVTQGMPHVRIGLGLHPWWVNEASLDDFFSLLPQTRWVGEVGIDLSPKRAHHEQQVNTFAQIAERCARDGDKVLSLHSVRAADVVLDILEKTGCTRSCSCIFHWFSGSTEALWRAIRAGCWFSVNEMQAGTRRAKEQLKLIPADRLLLETDLPPEGDASTHAADVLASLERVRNQLERIRRKSMAEQLALNWEHLAL